MMKVCSAKPNVRPGGEQLREAVVRDERDPHPARDEEHEDEQQAGRPDQAELLRDRRVDEVGVEVGDDRVAGGRREGPAPEPGAAEAAVADRVEALDELERAAVLAQRQLAGLSAVDRLARPRVQPDRHALVHVGDALVDERGAADEEDETREHVRRASGRGVHHREEDPELQQGAAEVVRLHEHEHRGAPEQEQRPEILEPALRERLALVAQVGGEEDDQHDLRELAGLELERADLDPQPRAVDRLADPRDRRQRHQDDRGDPEQVLVALEPPVVVAEREQRQREERDPDHDPERLAEGVVGVQPVDHRHADRREQRGQRQQHGVGLGHGEARDEVGGEVQREEDARVGERGRVDERAARDVDAREADRREEPHGDQVQQLPIS